MDKMYARYKNDVEFLGIYIREAHPTDGWRLASNDKVGIAIAQPRTIEERLGVAAQCSTALEVSMPLLVDRLDNAVESVYSAFPDRLYLIDKKGRIAFKSGRGPFGFEPRELERSLAILLLEQARDAVQPPAETVGTEAESP
ncbi:MAG: hypothetical protein CMJ64_30435 [Planctomycetaceae bacterium]|jgi:hypothetical protein|nr:hypothetical protein [Planctomycetaceae bacterium]